MGKGKIHAVITGDLVDSTAISKNYHDELLSIANDIKEFHSSDFLFEIYRGDSFQAYIKDPSKALLFSILIRAGLRRQSRGTSIEEAWDARVSIGIGHVYKKSRKVTNHLLGTLDGEAFIRSGRSLDEMKKEEVRLKITTGDEQLDKEFEAACPLADNIINHWTTSQAEAVYLHLLKNDTQKEIGKELETTQRAISKRLDASNLESMNNFFKRYQEVITWKFSN
jgi:hypothetical protein